jgi:tripartite-type tricarboxylate transporter receptor subunit TctC
MPNSSVGIKVSRRSVLSLVAAVTAAPYVLHAQVRDKPIKIVVGSPPGASLDSLARMVAESMQASLGQPVLVENKPGAAGRIAAEFVKNAAPDGSVILVTPSANVVAQPLAFAKLRYEPFKDFAPVSHLASFQMVMAVSPSVPARNVSELIEQIRKRPDLAAYGSPSVGSLLHFLGELFSSKTGLPMVHVPFNGTPQLTQALIGGQVPMGFLVLSDSVPLRDRLRIVATSGEQRSSLLPDVPTFKELGYPIAGTAWFAGFLPVGTPQPIVQTLSAAMQRAVKDKEVRARLERIGLEPVGSTPDELADLHRRDYAHWGPVIRASGFKADE